MLLTHRTQDGIDTVNIVGRLAMEDAAEAREQIKSIIEQGQGRLLVNLEQLSFIDSSGLSVLVHAFKLLHEKSGKIVLSNASAEIRSLIELTRLNEIFEIYAEADAAIAALQAH